MSGKTRYIVSIMERLPDGRNAWQRLLNTDDEAEAKALYDSLMADEGVRARLETVSPKR
jgi:hypothetical protein